MPRPLCSRNQRQWSLIGNISEVHIDEVDCRGMDTNKDFATLRKWVGDITKFKNLRTTDRPDLNRFHNAISLLPVSGTIAAAIIRKVPTRLSREGARAPSRTACDCRGSPPGF